MELAKNISHLNLKILNTREIFIMDSIQALELNISRHKKYRTKENFKKGIILAKELYIVKQENKYIKDFLLIINISNLISFW